MSARIAPGARKVSWTGTGEVAIGHYQCDWCGVETPPPPDDVVIDFVRDRPNASTLWPARDDGWRPPGWHWTDDAFLCPECHKQMMAAVGQVRAARKRGER